MPRSFASASRGFSLIELMVAAAVVAILAVVAIPNLRDFVHTNRLRAGSNELVASLQSARSEAVRLNTRAVICRSTDGSTCVGSNGAWQTWVVLADVDRDGAVDDLVRTGTIPAPVVVSTSAAVVNGTLTFRPDGMARTAAGLPLGANFGICVTGTSLPQNRRLVSVLTGSRFMTTPDSNSTCATPPDP